jgi:hypothetical protein
MTAWARRRIAAIALAAAGMVAGTAAAAGPVRFAVMGDAPYFPFEVPIVARLVAKTAELPLGLILHVGDLKASFEPCTDALVAARLRMLAAAPRPLVYTPGDNDWTDCHRERAGRHEPRERLAALRRLAFPDERSLGTPRIVLERQSADPRHAAYVENARWITDGVLFVTLHVPGSNNNLGRTADADEEHAERMRANLAWLDAARQRLARPETGALVVTFHADPRFDRGSATAARRDGFASLRGALAAIARGTTKPVVVVHGDSHAFTFDQPLLDPRSGRPFANVWRVESFGTPQLALALVTIDPKAKPPVRVAPYYLPQETATQ